MKKLKNNAVFGNTGHSDNNIDLAGSKGLECRKVDNVVTVLSCWFQADCGIYLRGHPSFEVSYSFTDQVLARLDFLRYWKVNEACRPICPGIVGGFHDTSLQSNMKCDVYICKELYAMSRCHVARPQ